MLYFSKIKLFIIYTVIVFLSFFTFLNFADNEDNFLLSKKVNLGLDLQGGSYLLLEVDSKPIINQQLQQKLLKIRSELKENNINYKNLKLHNEIINFNLLNRDIKKFEDFFLNNNNSINFYYEKYRAYEMDYFIKENTVSIEFSKIGLIEIKPKNCPKDPQLDYICIYFFRYDLLKNLSLLDSLILKQ